MKTLSVRLSSEVSGAEVEPCKAVMSFLRLVNMVVGQTIAAYNWAEG